MKIKGSLKVRVLTLVASVALLGGTALVASGQTGAYFSDSHSGTLTGTVGSILISPDSASVMFSNLLPGVPQTYQLNFHNSGTSPEDVYLTFPNSTALSALNNLGRYGSVVITSSVGGPDNTVFSSGNLNDNTTRCGAGFQVPPAYGPSSGCWPLTSQVLLASNVAAGAYGNFKFTFEYASADTGPTAVPWNTYPLPGDLNNSLSYAACLAVPLTASQCSDNQTTINPADVPPSGNGLPFQLVATQVGILPGAAGSKF